jgi:FlaA1/EpsC-like NDP-sugar epimerase
MTIVTGAAGTLGSEICRQLGGDIIAIDVNEYGLWKLSNELDVRVMCDSITREHLWRDLAKRDVDLVINCAAVKHVVTSQKHPDWANIVNVEALYHIFAYADWKVVHISTDKAVIPTCAYGLQKLNAERYALNHKGVVVRLVNIHNSSGCAEEIFAKQIAAGGPVTARDPKMKRYYTTVEQAAADVIAIAQNADKGLYMPDPGEPVIIDELIREMIREEFSYDDDITDDELHVKIIHTGIQDGEKYEEDILTDYEKVEPVAWSDRVYKVVRK